MTALPETRDTARARYTESGKRIMYGLTAIARKYITMTAVMTVIMTVKMTSDRKR